MKALAEVEVCSTTSRKKGITDTQIIGSFTFQYDDNTPPHLMTFALESYAYSYLETYGFSYHDMRTDSANENCVGIYTSGGDYFKAYRIS